MEKYHDDGDDECQNDDVTGFEFNFRRVIVKISYNPSTRAGHGDLVVGHREEESINL